MKATQKLHDSGQSLWLDNITRELLNSGTLKRYIDTLSVTGLTSNPTIFDHAISKSAAYDQDIRALTKSGLRREDLFFKLAISDLQRAADLFRPIHGRTAGVDGWVSLEVSPLLAYDAERTVAAAKSLHAEAARPNLFIKIPGTKEGLSAIEETTFSGVTVNVTLLFSREHYLASVDAYMRGLERRIAAGLSPDVRSVASLFVSRWDKVTMDKLPAEFRDRLGIAVAKSTYAAYRDLLDSDRWQRLENAGARATIAVREHGHKGSRGTRHPLHWRVGSPQHGQHYARGDAVGLRRSWRTRRRAAAQRTRRRRHARRDQQGGRRPRGTGGGSAGGGREVVR
jgi:transaldolase